MAKNNSHAVFKNSLALRFPSSCFLLTPDPCVKLLDKQNVLCSHVTVIFFRFCDYFSPLVGVCKFKYTLDRCPLVNRYFFWATIPPFRANKKLIYSPTHTVHLARSLQQLWSALIYIRRHNRSHYGSCFHVETASAFS